jgi:hypothetical protein
MNQNVFDVQAAYQEALAFYPADPSPEQQASVRADLDLCLRFPGEYVIFVDRWEKGPGGQVELRREVLAHGAELQGVGPDALSLAAGGQAVLRYLPGPEEGRGGVIPEPGETPHTAG